MKTKNPSRSMARRIYWWLEILAAEAALDHHPVPATIGIVVVTRDNAITPNRITESVESNEETLGINRHSAMIAADVNMVRRTMVRAIAGVVTMTISAVRRTIIMAVPVVRAGVRIHGTK
jgi:hypothetical protein